MDAAEKLYVRAAELIRDAAGARSDETRRRLLRQAKALGLQAAERKPDEAAVGASEADAQSSG